VQGGHQRSQRMTLRLVLMNGTNVLEGYVPDVDATVVTRILDAGGEIVGKAVCESLCFSGGSHTVPLRRWLQALRRVFQLNLVCTNTPIRSIARRPSGMMRA
jgi:hypothetical protein